MAYSQPWDNTAPADASAANLLGQDIRNTKISIQERIDDVFGTSGGSSITTADPYRPITFKLTGASATKILIGSGSTTFRDSADTNDILKISGDKSIVANGNAANTLYDLGNISGPITIDWNNGNNQKGTLTGNVTFTFNNPKAGAFYYLQLTQDATGSRTCTFPASCHFSAGLSSSLTTTALQLDGINFAYNGSIYLSGFAFRNVSP